MAEIHDSLFSQLEKLAESDEISSKGNRRRSQKDRAIYTPGSGPLKKSENCDDEAPVQQTQSNKNSKKNQKSESSKEDKVSNNNGNRSQGGKKDNASQPAQYDKNINPEKNAPKTANVRNDLNSKDFKSRKPPNSLQGNKNEPPASKEPRSDFEDKSSDGKQKNRKPDSQIYVVPKPARASNSHEQLNELSKENQCDFAKNKTFPKSSKHKFNNFRNEPNKNFARAHNDHDKRRPQSQKFSRESEDVPTKLNPKGNDESHQSKPFRDGRNRNFSHSSCDESSRPPSSFPANKLNQPSEPCNKPQTLDNSGTNSTNISSNHNNKSSNDFSHLASQNQDLDTPKNLGQVSDSRSFQQNSPGGNLNKNQLNSEPSAPPVGDSWPNSKKFSEERRPMPNRNTNYESGHSYRRNSNHRRGSFNDRSTGHERGLVNERGSGQDKGPGRDRSSGHERGFGHDRGFASGRNHGPNPGSHPDKSFGHVKESHPERALSNDSGPYPERRPGMDRGMPPDRFSTQSRVHVQDRGPGVNKGSEKGPDMSYPYAGRGRHMPDRGPLPHDKGQIVGHGFNSVKGSNPDLRSFRTEHISDPRESTHETVERNPSIMRHAAVENSLSTERLPRNDHTIPPEPNPLPEKDRYPDRNNAYNPGPGPDRGGGSFPLNRNAPPSVQNWNPNQEQNFPHDRHPINDRGPPHLGWDLPADRIFPRGRGIQHVDRNQLMNNAQPNIRRPLDQGPTQDFHPGYDMPPSHDAPPPMMSQGPPHERPMRDRMSNKPPQHQKNNKSTFIAPRFLRKAMEENRMKNLNQNMDYIGTNSEHKWDGTSATYSSRRDNYPANSAPPPPPPTNLPPSSYNQPSQYSHPPTFNNWATPHPLPNPKGRGKSFQHMNGPDSKFMNDRPGRTVTPDPHPGIIRTNALNKAYHSNDGWKNNESNYPSERSRDHPDECSGNRRERRLLSQSDTSSVDYQTKIISRDSFSSDHSEKVNINGNREDSSEEEEEDDEKDSLGKSVPNPFSMNWADAVDKDDDELSEPPQRNEEPGSREPIRSPTDRNLDRNRRRRKKRRSLKLTTRSVSQDRDRSRRRDSNASSSRQDVRFIQNETLDRKEWGRSKPIGNDRNRRRDNAGGWNNERPFNRDRDRDRGGRDRRRDRNRDRSKRGMDKHRDRERSDRDPENWRARTDSMSDSKPDYEPRSRDEVSRKKDHLQDGPVHREPLETPKCPSIGGILVLPAETSTSKDIKNFTHPHPEASLSTGQTKQLFDPNNPGRPIYVPLAHTRPGLLSERSLNVSFPDRGTPFAPQSGGGDLVSASSSLKPLWYDPHSESFKSAKDQSLLLDICRGDLELQWLYSTNVIQHWSRITELRIFFERALEALLVHDLKFCEAENIESHIWKIAYHNLIELLRKLMLDSPEQKDIVRNYLLQLIEQGTEYFKKLLNRLEETYKIKFDTYVSAAEKFTGLTSIALISAQKLFIFLGDLARYKEQVNETSNYGSARNWYLKAREMNPKNGKPYNQLALIAFCSKRKIDAVYYYMRSLMASNPIQSAKESLLSLFDNNRKKYESIEKKRMEDREKKNKDKAKEKESFTDRNKKRREIWIRPDDGTRKKMTLTTKEDSEDEELSLLSHIEVNKRFGVSFLHIQGKLFNKVGMETFQDAAHQMLREFRALLQHSPMALNVTRFLQLLALNMFAIDNTQLKDKQLGGELEVRTVQQESALLVSLQMFNIILERTIQLLKEQFAAEGKGPLPHQNVVGSDLEILLPAIKVWCDWLMYHEKVWNPPPSCRDYLVGPASADCWNRLATLANYIEKLEFKNSELIEAEEQPKDFVLVSLPEDSLLSGFSPLTSPYPSIGSVYTSKLGDLDVAQMHHRVEKLLFFTTIYLRGLEPPVLKLQKNDLGHSEYISVVEAATSSGDQSDAELCTESMSEEDCDAIQIGEEVESDLENYDDDSLEKNSPTKETRNLLLRKEHLERVHQKKERYERQVNAILEQCSYSVEMEVKPKYLVPDTNCFIDYLAHLRSITKVTTGTNENLYSLMVPVIVQNELQGLSRGIKKSAEVAESAKEALEFLCSQSSHAVKCVTTKGAIIHHASNFTEEEDSVKGLKNDDKILETCINLCKSKPAEEPKEGEPRKIHRNVVLLTDDRHLRVKALCRDMPVRTVPDFIRWAGLG